MALKNNQEKEYIKLKSNRKKVKSKMKLYFTILKGIFPPSVRASY